jgi:hypothetical protein
VLTLTRAVRFCLFERTSFAAFVHGRLTRTRSRSIVLGRRIRASRDESRATKDYPFHVQASVEIVRLLLAQNNRLSSDANREAVM